MNALAKPEVGAYINKFYVSSFQKVATFTIVNGAKQGGNVAAYFCAPDGRVLHCVAGPVGAEQMLHEATWVVETVRSCNEESKKSGTPFKTLFRRLHAERLRSEHGLVVTPIEFDAPADGGDGALTYNDPSGRPLVPVLPPAPIDGPDVRFEAAQAAEFRSAGARKVADASEREWVLGNQGRVHQILAAHALVPIERVYATVFENILGEKVTTKPVVTIGRVAADRPGEVCLRCGVRQ